MRRTLLGLIAFLFCLGSPGNILLAADYWVRNDGAPSGGNGSAGNPWGTITEAFGSGLLLTGDTLHILDGTYAAGEVFPLSPPVDGLVIQGENGAANVTIDGTGFAGATFLIGPTANTTILQDLTIAAHTSLGVGVLMSSAAAHDLELRDNNISAGLFAVCHDGAGSGSLVMDNNNLAAASAARFRGVFFAAHAATGPYNLLITNNTITGNGALGVGVHLSISGSGNFDAAISDNDLPLNEDGFIFRVGCSTALTPSTASLALNNNTVTGWVDKALDVSLNASGVSAVATMAISASGNSFSSGSAEGVDFDLFALGASALAQITGAFDCNAIRNAGGDGIAVAVNASISGRASFEPDFNNNSIRNGGEDGIDFMLGTSATANVALLSEFRGNTIRGNSENGVALSSAGTNGGTFSYAAAFFGTSADAGRNTLAANNAAAGAFYEMAVYGADNPVTLNFIGNFWNDSSSAAIEDDVLHSVDSAGLHTVDFASHYNPILTFTATNVSPGQLVTVNAGLGSLFVPKDGNSTLLVTFAGTPVVATVAPDGLSLTFTAPAVLPPGTWPLVITNPGGQSGTLNFGADGNAEYSDKLCFIATAAFGDNDAPSVLLLRRWRNECLATNGLGRQVIQAYYSLSPPLAEWVSEREWARTVSRAALAPVVGAVKLWMDLPWIFGLAGAAVLWQLMRRRRTLEPIAGGRDS